MPLFEGGQFNKAALGPLQNLFRSRGGGQTNGGGGDPSENGQGPSNSEFWDEGLGAMEDLESDAGNWWQNFKNGKSKQPLINKEDQSMRLPNFLFPKQNPNSILNFPGKAFNQGKESLGQAFNQGKEGLEKAKDAIGKGYGDVFGQGGLLAKADFGGVVNPWAARDANLKEQKGANIRSGEESIQSADDVRALVGNVNQSVGSSLESLVPTENGDQGGFINPATYGQSETPTLDTIKGGLSNAYQGFKDFDFTNTGEPSNDEGNQGGVIDPATYGQSNTPTLDAIKGGAQDAYQGFKNFDFEQFIGEDGQPITDPEEIQRIMSGNQSSGQGGAGNYYPPIAQNNNLQNNNFWNRFQNLGK